MRVDFFVGSRVLLIGFTAAHRLTVLQLRLVQSQLQEVCLLKTCYWQCQGSILTFHCNLFVLLGSILILAISLKAWRGASDMCIPLLSWSARFRQMVLVLPKIHLALALFHVFNLLDACFGAHHSCNSKLILLFLIPRDHSF